MVLLLRQWWDKARIQVNKVAQYSLKPRVILQFLRRCPVLWEPAEHPSHKV